MDKQIIVERLKALRKKSNLTQEQIAEYLEVDQSFVNKIENGSRGLNENTIEKLCALYGCDESYLMGEDDDVIPLTFAFRANVLKSEDLKGIADANRLALNIRKMNRIIRENNL